MITFVPYSSPVFYDKKIEKLNKKLSELKWITRLYPIAWIGEDDQGVYPEIYYNDGSTLNVRVLPEGSAISFYQIEGDIVEVEDYHYSVPMSLTVWADLRLVYPTKKYDYTAELIKDIVIVLRNNSCNDIVVSTDQVLNEFTYLQKQLQQNTMRPYTAFKITFNYLTTIC